MENRETKPGQEAPENENPTQHQPQPAEAVEALPTEINGEDRNFHALQHERLKRLQAENLSALLTFQAEQRQRQAAILEQIKIVEKTDFFIKSKYQISAGDSWSDKDGVINRAEKAGEGL